MKYLLDVNALLAWRHADAEDHAAFHACVARVGLQSLATCALAELGFIRVSMQAFGYSLPEARDALATMKRAAGGFVGQAPSPKPPAWCTKAAQTSDAFLAQVAETARLHLATFANGIPGATVIR